MSIKPFNNLDYVMNSFLSTQEGKGMINHYKNSFPQLHQELQARVAGHAKAIAKIKDPSSIDPFASHLKDLSQSGQQTSVPGITQSTSMLNSSSNQPF